MAGTFQVGVVFDRRVRDLFSVRSWNNALKSAMIEAGRGFIFSRLPLRFTNFAITRLGYNAKKLDKAQDRETEIRIAIAMMRRDGSYDRLVATYCARWGGWDPTSKDGAPQHIWLAWVKDALRSGKIHASKSGDWRSARKKMREEALRETNIRDRIRNYAIDEYVDQNSVTPSPLIASGELFKNHQKWARPEATAKGGNGVLQIKIPRKNKVHPQVNKVLSATTPEEAQEVGEEVRASLQAMVDRSKVKTSKKGKRTAAFAGRDRSRIALNIRNATVRSHRNRRPAAHSPRT